MHPYFTFKDLVTIFLFFLVLSIMVFYYPNLLGDYPLHDSILCIFNTLTEVCINFPDILYSSTIFTQTNHNLRIGGEPQKQGKQTTNKLTLSQIKKLIK